MTIQGAKDTETAANWPQPPYCSFSILDGMPAKPDGQSNLDNFDISSIINQISRSSLTGYFLNGGIQTEFPNLPHAVG
jgi:hypothetical protein